MVLLNLWSLGHFLQWTAVGRFLLKNWPVFFLLSIGWEVLELYLPFELVRGAYRHCHEFLVSRFHSGFVAEYPPGVSDVKYPWGVSMRKAINVYGGRKRSVRNVGKR